MLLFIGKILHKSLLSIYIYIFSPLHLRENIAKAKGVPKPSKSSRMSFL